MHVTIKGYPTIFAVKGVGQSSFLLWFQEATRKATLDSNKKGKAPARGSSKRKASEPEAPAPSTSRVTTSELNSSCFEDSEVEDLAPVQASSKRVRPLGSMPIVPTTSDDEKVREKVRLGKFVDFKSLLPHPRGQKPRKKFTLSDGYFEEVEDNENLVFYKWLDAYIIYMSLTLEFFPGEAQGMLRHLQIVKRMHAAEKEAVEYDFQFRKLKAQHADIVWGEYLTELANNIQQPVRKDSKKTSDQDRSGAKLSQKRKLCHKFNSHEGCKFGLSCRFAHKCKVCYSSQHPDYRCSKQKAS